MVITASFWIFLLSSLAVFYIFGKEKERVFTFIILIATAVTYTSYSHYGLGKLNYIVVSTDLFLLFIGLLFTLKFEAYWPIWFSGFHFNTTATNAAAILFPSDVPSLLLNLSGAWALPALGIAAYGVWLDHHAISKPSAALD